MTDVRTIAGPLDDEGLAAIAGLYGRTDAKYSSPVFLRHLFVDNPYGWSLHSFAYDGDTPVGHCAAIPLRARTGWETVTSGKVEAYFIDERYRGARDGGPSLALELLVALSDAAQEHGIDPLHAYVSPRVGGIFERAGYTAHATGGRAYVLVSGASGAALRAVAAGQGAVTALAGAVLRGGPVRVEAPTGGDAALVDPGSVGPAWTIAGSDSWEWFAASGFVSALEVAGGRAVFALQGQGQPLHLLGWHPERPGVRRSVALLAGLRRVARQRSASTVRVQPWPGVGDEASLVRACRMLGLAPRAPLTIYSRSASAGVPAPSPFFYATF